MRFCNTFTVCPRLPSARFYPRAIARKSIVLRRDIHAARKAVIAGWSEQSGLDADALGRHTFVYRDAEAVRHLFGVACGLDSMIMGEPQIAGQVKEAGAAALSMGTSKTVLNRLFRAATEVSKRARTETEIATGAVSVSFAAVELAKKIFGNLEGHTALVLGAGEMSELTARHLADNGVKSLLVTSRTFERAQNLAVRVGGRAISWDDGNRQFARGRCCDQFYECGNLCSGTRPCGSGDAKAQ